MTDLAEELEPDLLEEVEDSVLEEIKFHSSRKLIVDFSEEDSEALNVIRSHAEKVYLDIFGVTLNLIDEIYEKTSQGENFGLLASRELESYLLRLSRERITITTAVNSTKLDCLWAKYGLDDDYHASYLASSGTNSVREAKAHTDTIQKRYSYYFRYYVYTMSQGLERETESIIRNLSSMIYRRSTH